MAAASAASALRRAALPAALENGPHRWVMDLGTEIWQVGFAKTLGLNNSLEVQNYSHEEGLTAKYTVPETVCVGDATRKYLPCGVTAAVFDEFSTLAMMLKDKTHRAGVSVTLSAEMFRKVEPGQKLRINSRATKIGKIMGYADMTAETECGTLVARGRHVKFLPMGRAWDLLMLPPLLPVAAAFHKRDIAKRLQDPERTMGIPAGQTLTDQLVLHQLLLHEEAEEASTIRSSSTTNAANSGTSDSSSSCGDSAREASPPTRILRGSAVLDIPVRLHNYVGTFHGGAISASAEHMARATCPYPESEQSHWVKHMETQYLTGQKRSAELVSEFRSDGLGTGCSEVTFMRKGQIMANTRMIWGKHA